MIPTSTQARRDFSHVTPETLTGLNDDDFREIVNIDMKRNATNPTRRLAPGVSDALRSPQLRQRWLLTLTRILFSVDSQLEIREADYFKRMAELQKQAMRATKDGGSDGHRAESHTLSIRSRVSDLKVDFWAHRTKTLKFRAVVVDTSQEARRVCGLRDSGDQVLRHERDRQAERVRLLERGVTLHRELVLADLEDGEIADDIDIELWSLVPEAL